MTTVDDQMAEDRRQWFRSTVQQLHDDVRAVVDGAAADYIPELARVDPDRFAIAVETIDGRHFSVGDCSDRFTIQSISKLLLYGLALETHGRERVLERVGVAPTGDSFNAITLDEHGNRAPNPMVNAGAIAITDLVEGDGLDDRAETVRRMYEQYLGHRPEPDRAVWESEQATGHRNRAIAYLMLSRGIIDDRVEETLDLYFAQCSVLVTTDDLAAIGATIANHGVNPRTGERVVRPSHSPAACTTTPASGRSPSGSRPRAASEAASSGSSPGWVASQPSRPDSTSTATASVACACSKNCPTGSPCTCSTPTAPGPETPDS